MLVAAARGLQQGVEMTALGLITRARGRRFIRRQWIVSTFVILVSDFQRPRVDSQTTELPRGEIVGNPS